MDSAKRPRSRRCEWIGAGLLLGLALSCSVHDVVQHFDSSSDHRNQLGVFINWTSAYVIASVILLLCFGSRRRLLQQLAVIGLTPLIAFLSVALAMYGWRWYCNDVVRPSDREIAAEFAQAKIEFNSGVQRLQAGLDHEIGPPLDPSSPDGIRTVVLQPDEGLLKLGVKRAIARPDRRWIWLVTWTPSEYAPPFLKGLVFHPDEASTSLQDAVKAAGSEVVAISEAGDGWYVFTARDFFE